MSTPIWPKGRTSDALERLRNLCRRYLPDFEECIAYGVPGFKRNGNGRSGICQPKAVHRPLRNEKGLLDEFRESLGASSIGKGCIHFRGMVQASRVTRIRVS